MPDNKRATSEQLRQDLAPAASPLGTDDEAGGTTPSADRVELARKAEEKIGASAEPTPDDVANDHAHSQRGSSTGYGKEEHMNEELAKQKERDQVEEDPSDQPS